MAPRSLFRGHNLLMTGLLLLSTSTAALAQQNLVQNGDFSNATNGWYWWAAPKCKATGALDQTEKHSGVQSYKISNTSEVEPNVFGGLSQKIDNLQPKTTYRLTVWVKGQGVSHCWIGGGVGWNQRMQLPAGTFDWKPVSMEMKTGENETSLEIRVNVDGPTEALWVDDIEFAPATGNQTSRMYAPAVYHKLPASVRVYPALSASVADAPLTTSFRAPEDPKFGADVQVRWSDRAALLHLEVFDPTASASLPAESMWRGDSVQIALDADPLTSKAGYTHSCVEIGAALNANGQVDRYCFFSADQDTFDIKQIQGTGRRTATGYILDLTIPWKNLGLNAAPEVFGLNVLVNDSQANGVRRFVEWTPGIGVKKEPDQYVRVHKVAPSQTSASYIVLDQMKYDSTQTISGRYLDIALRPLPAAKITLERQAPGGQFVSIPDFSAALPAAPGGSIREIQFTLPAKDLAEEGSHTLQATLHDMTGAAQVVASASVLREDLATRVAQQLPVLQDRFNQLKNRLAAHPDAAKDTYMQMGYAIAERFVSRVATGGPGKKQSAEWSWLQISETMQVLGFAEQRLDRLIGGTAAVEIAPLPPGKVVVRDGLLQMDGYGPAYLYGYGHFGQIIKDLPNFPTLGANFVQQERGPNSLQSDGTLNERGKSVVDLLKTVNAANMRMDLLLSPHYFPEWAFAQSPDVRVSEKGWFLNYDIDHPLAREVVERFLHQILPLVKDAPALASLCLTNEPNYPYSGRTPSSRGAWTNFLRGRYGSIESANATFETHYKTFEEIPVPPMLRPADMAGSRQYFDWIVFNQQNFAAWHRWMNDIVKAEAPNVPTSAKVMNTIFDPGSLQFGADPELICNITDLAGNDAWAWPLDGNAKYCYEWQSEEMWYDLLHSFRGQPVFNSENHFIRDRSPAATIPAAFTRSVMWQGALHHQSATVLWVWDEPASHSDLEGSIYLRPGNVYKAGQAFFDLRRNAADVARISQQKAKVALLYSIPSIYWQPDYSRTLLRTYAALQFLGQPVTFISERQLANGTRSPANDGATVLILPRATHMTSDARKGIEKFTAAGGRVVALGEECLAFDDHNRPTPGAHAISVQLPMPTDEQSVFASLKEALPKNGVAVADLTVAGTDAPAWGVEYRVVPSAKDGRTLVALTNLTQKPISVSIPVAGRAVDLLDDGRVVNGNAVELLPMEPRLVLVKTSN